MAGEGEDTVAGGGVPFDGDPNLMYGFSVLYMFTSIASLIR